VKTLRIVVLPVLFVAVAALAAAASASAHSWTYVKQELTKTNEATSEGELTFTLSGAGAESEEFRCHIWREYLVGPGGSGELRKVKETKYGSEKIKCPVQREGNIGLGGTATVEAAGLPWPTELYGEGTAILDRFKQDGGTNRWLIRNSKGQLMWECFAEKTALEVRDNGYVDVEVHYGGQSREACTAGARELTFSMFSPEFIEDERGKGLGVN